MLKGHKFSLYDGGVRMPAILNWPGQVPAGQVIHEPGAMMDIFPTFVNAAGGSASDYDCDGLDILGMAARGEPSPHGAIFWEMNKQTAVRRGPWKLVLEGQLVEGAPPEDAVHLSNLDEDMGERVNLKDEAPEICVELREAAEDWREGLEKYWQARWEGRNSGLTGHPAKQ